MQEELKLTEQSKLFYDIQNMKYRIQSLAGFVQNDFDKMILDNFINKEEIKNSINDMDESYKRFISDLKKLQKRSKEIMLQYCEDEDNIPKQKQMKKGDKFAY